MSIFFQIDRSIQRKMLSKIEKFKNIMNNPQKSDDEIEDTKKNKKKKTKRQDII